jgi:hypothetical protein
MISPSRRERDEFLKALEEARRAAMADEEEVASQASERTSPEPARSSDFFGALDRMAGRIRTYISAGLLSRFYADDAFRSADEPEPIEPEAQPAPHQTHPPQPPKSEHEAVIDELHLTPNLTCEDLARIRREFAKINHPDRVLPPLREEATRRMTIANSVIDEALRGKRG